MGSKSSSSFSVHATSYWNANATNGTANGVPSTRVLCTSSNASTSEVFQPSTGKRTRRPASLATTATWSNPSRSNANGHECWFQNSRTIWTKSESSPSCCRCSNGCSPNGSTNDAGYDERSRSNSTTSCRSTSSSPSSCS